MPKFRFTVSVGYAAVCDKSVTVEIPDAELDGPDREAVIADYLNQWVDGVIYTHWDELPPDP